MPRALDERAGGEPVDISTAAGMDMTRVGRVFLLKTCSSLLFLLLSRSLVSSRALAAADRGAALRRAGGCWRRNSPWSSFQLLQGDFQPPRRCRSDPAWQKVAEVPFRQRQRTAQPRWRVPAAGARALQGGPGAAVPASRVPPRPRSSLLN